MKIEPKTFKSVEEKTLRDEFAMAALTGLCANKDCTDYVASALANWSYEIAGAMMRERDKI